MSAKSIAKLMELKGLTEDQVRIELAAKQSLKDNINDYLDEKNVWISFNDLLSVSKRYHFNKGEEITERGLKIMLSRMRDTAEIFRSDNSGYWWSTVTSDAKDFPTTAIPSEWKPKKAKVGNGGNGLGVRGKRATSADKFYFTILNAIVRGDKVPDSTIEMARLEYANLLSIQFGRKAKLEDIQSWLKAGETARLARKEVISEDLLSEDEDQEIDNKLLAAALMEDDSVSEVDNDSETEEE